MNEKFTNLMRQIASLEHTQDIEREIRRFVVIYLNLHFKDKSISLQDILENLQRGN